MLYFQFTGLWDYSIHHLHLPKQPAVIYSFLSTDDSLDYQSSSEIKGRIFPSSDRASQLTEGTTVDPEGIPDDLIIINFLNAVADQKCKICSLKLLTSFESVLADAIVDERQLQSGTQVVDTLALLHLCILLLPFIALLQNKHATLAESGENLISTQPRISTHLE